MTNQKIINRRFEENWEVNQIKIGKGFKIQKSGSSKSIFKKIA